MSSSEDEILDAVEVAAIAARVEARARHYTRPTRVEARLGQNIFVKQVVSIGAVISRSSHFICVFLTLKVQPPAVIGGGARDFQLWMRYLRRWVELPPRAPRVVPKLTGAYRRFLWDP